MKVKILKADFPIYWYSDFIGEIFEVEEDGCNCYKITSGIIYGYFDKYIGWKILKHDCEIIENNIIKENKMSKAFIIKNEIKPSPSKPKYPELPFIIKLKNNYNDFFIVCRDMETELYTYINLKNGNIHNMTFKSLDEMFKQYPNDIILTSELKITGEY